MSVTVEVAAEDTHPVLAPTVVHSTTTATRTEVDVEEIGGTTEEDVEDAISPRADKATSPRTTKSKMMVAAASATLTTHTSTQTPLYSLPAPASRTTTMKSASIGLRSSFCDYKAWVERNRVLNSSLEDEKGRNRRVKRQGAAVIARKSEFFHSCP